MVCLQLKHRNITIDYNQAYSQYKHSLTLRVRRYVVRRNETRAPIANPPNSTQLEGIPTIPPSYIRGSVQ